MKKSKILALLIVLFIFLYIIKITMAAETWGQLPKSQNDPETIEQAIARLIGTHEGDPTSHMGPGEAIEAHRTQEIVDHPQGSILGDKYTNREFTLNLPFESLDNYQKSTSGVSSDIAGFRLDTGGIVNTVRYLYAPAQYSDTYFNYNRDLTFQFYALLYGGTDYTAYVMAGGNGLNTEPPGVGFKFINGALYACEVVWAEEDYQEYLEPILGVSLSIEHIYRVVVRALDQQADFYVDGELVATMNLHESVDVGLVMFSTYIKNTTAAQKQLNVHGIYYSLNANPV